MRGQSYQIKIIIPFFFVLYPTTHISNIQYFIETSCKSASYQPVRIFAVSFGMQTPIQSSSLSEIFRVLQRGKMEVNLEIYFFPKKLNISGE